MFPLALWWGKNGFSLPHDHRCSPPLSAPFRPLPPRPARCRGVGCTFAAPIFDEMRALSANWFYPLPGPFQCQMKPGYTGTCSGLEISNPGEWMFMTGSVAILAESYQSRTPIPSASLPDSIKNRAYMRVVAVLPGTGLYLVNAGLTSTTGTFITALCHQVPTVSGWVPALCDAVIMPGETFDTPRGQSPYSCSGPGKNMPEMLQTWMFLLRVHHGDNAECRNHQCHRTASG